MNPFGAPGGACYEYVDAGNGVGYNLNNLAGYAILVRCTSASIPTSKAGYAVGCMLEASDTGFIYSNQGTTTSCSFVQLAQGGGGGLSIPFTETDNITTTGA